MKARLALFSAFLCATLIGVSGCGVKKALQPAEPKGFIDRASEDDSGIVSKKFPFQYVWVDKKRHDEEGFEKILEPKIYVAPVGIKYLGELKRRDRWLQDSVAEVAIHFHDRIIKEIEQVEPKVYKPSIVKNREDADFAMEIEIVEVGFGDPLLYVAAFAAPVPGVATAYDLSHQSVLAFEARLVEVATERVVTTAADRKVPKLRLLDLNKAVSKTAPLRDISNDWALEISRSMVVDYDTTDEVEGSARATLVPW